jgi:hypothetical protein
MGLKEGNTQDRNKLGSFKESKIKKVPDEPQQGIGYWNIF